MNKTIKKLIKEIKKEEDVIKINVPTFIRMLEYAREDAKTDMDLHVATENILEILEDKEYITMEDYEKIVKGKREDE